MSHSTSNYELIRTYYNGQGTEFTIRKRQPTTFIGIFICIAGLLGVKLWTIKESAISSVQPQVSSTHHSSFSIMFNTAFNFRNNNLTFQDVAFLGAIE